MCWLFGLMQSIVFSFIFLCAPPGKLNKSFIIGEFSFLLKYSPLMTVTRRLPSPKNFHGKDQDVWLVIIICTFKTNNRLQLCRKYYRVISLKCLSSAHCNYTGNVAFGRPTKQSGTFNSNTSSDRAVDGDTDSKGKFTVCGQVFNIWEDCNVGLCSRTSNGRIQFSYWRVDLGSQHVVYNVTLFNSFAGG